MTGTSTADQGTVALDAAPRDTVLAVLLGCCDAPDWAARVADRRPWGTAADARRIAADELAATSEQDVDSALAAHPRIGEKPRGDGGANSRREQAGALGADRAVLDGLAAGNAEYEARFGHVYLVCASGRSGPELLEILRSRLDNDPVTERRVLRAELAAITDLRLRRVLEDSALKDSVQEEPVREESAREETT